eukprot:tig00020564_g11402.t1
MSLDAQTLHALLDPSASASASASSALCFRDVYRHAQLEPGDYFTFPWTGKEDVRVVLVSEDCFELLDPRQPVVSRRRRITVSLRELCEIWKQPTEDALFARGSFHFKKKKGCIAFAKMKAEVEKELMKNKEKRAGKAGTAPSGSSAPAANTFAFASRERALTIAKSMAVLCPIQGREPSPAERAFAEYAPQAVSEAAESKAAKRGNGVSTFLFGLRFVCEEHTSLEGAIGAAARAPLSAQRRLGEFVEAQVERAPREFASAICKIVPFSTTAKDEELVQSFQEMPPTSLERDIFTLFAIGREPGARLRPHLIYENRKKGHIHHLDFFRDFKIPCEERKDDVHVWIGRDEPRSTTRAVRWLLVRPEIPGTSSGRRPTICAAGRSGSPGDDPRSIELMAKIRSELELARCRLEELAPSKAGKSTTLSSLIVELMPPRGVFADYAKQCRLAHSVKPSPSTVITHELLPPEGVVDSKGRDCSEDMGEIYAALGGSELGGDSRWNSDILPSQPLGATSAVPVELLFFDPASCESPMLEFDWRPSTELEPHFERVRRDLGAVQALPSEQREAFKHSVSSLGWVKACTGLGADAGGGDKEDMPSDDALYEEDEQNDAVHELEKYSEDQIEILEVYKPLLGRTTRHRIFANTAEDIRKEVRRMLIIHATERKDGAVSHWGMLRAIRLHLPSTDLHNFRFKDLPGLQSEPGHAHNGIVMSAFREGERSIDAVLMLCSSKDEDSLPREVVPDVFAPIIAASSRIQILLVKDGDFGRGDDIPSAEKFLKSMEVAKKRQFRTQLQDVVAIALQNEAEPARVETVERTMRRVRFAPIFARPNWSRKGSGERPDFKQLLHQLRDVRAASLRAQLLPISLETLGGVLCFYATSNRLVMEVKRLSPDARKLLEDHLKQCAKSLRKTRTALQETSGLENWREAGKKGTGLVDRTLGRQIPNCAAAQTAMRLQKAFGYRVAGFFAAVAKEPLVPGEVGKSALEPLYDGALQLRVEMHKFLEETSLRRSLFGERIDMIKIRLLGMRKEMPPSWEGRPGSEEAFKVLGIVLCFLSRELDQRVRATVEFIQSLGAGNLCDFAFTGAEKEMEPALKRAVKGVDARSSEWPAAKAKVASAAPEIAKTGYDQTRGAIQNSFQSFAVSCGKKLGDVLRAFQNTIENFCSEVLANLDFAAAEAAWSGALDQIAAFVKTIADVYADDQSRAKLREKVREKLGRDGRAALAGAGLEDGGGEGDEEEEEEEAAPSVSSSANAALAQAEATANDADSSDEAEGLEEGGDGRGRDDDGVSIGDHEPAGPVLVARGKHPSEGPAEQPPDSKRARAEKGKAVPGRSLSNELASGNGSPAAGAGPSSGSSSSVRVPGLSGAEKKRAGPSSSDVEGTWEERRPRTTAGTAAASSSGGPAPAPGGSSGAGGGAGPSSSSGGGKESDVGTSGAPNGSSGSARGSHTGGPSVRGRCGGISHVKRRNRTQTGHGQPPAAPPPAATAAAVATKAPEVIVLDDSD